MMNQTRTDFSMGRRWLIFASVFFVGTMASFNMFKAPAIFSTLIPDLGFTDSTIGWVMSMFAMIGLVLAFPAGGILARIGIRMSLIITALSLTIGSALGALAPNVVVLLLSRFIEGVGMGLISVVGPAAIATIIPPQKQGLAMGLWGVWFPFGVILGMNSAPFITALAGWRAVWWVVALISLLSLLVVLFIYRQPPMEASEQQAEDDSVKVKPDYRSIIFVALAFMLWNIINGAAVSGFFPSFLQSVHQMDAQSAGFAASLTSIIVLILGPLSGVISDKLGTRKYLMVFAMGFVAVLLIFAFGENLSLVWVFIILMSLCSAAMPTGTFSIVPELAKKPAAIGTGMAIVAFFQNLGLVIGNAGFGPITVALGYHMTSLVVLIPCAVLGLVFTLFVKEKRRGK
jgi:predicted MFS family arabinose efflux permease